MTPIFETPNRTRSGSCLDSHRIAAVAKKHSTTRTSTKPNGSMMAGLKT